MLTKLSPTATAAVEILSRFGIKTCDAMFLAQRAEWLVKNGPRITLDNTGQYARVIITTNRIKHTIICHGDGVFDLEGPLASASAGIITGTADKIIRGISKHDCLGRPNFYWARKAVRRALDNTPPVAAAQAA